MRQRFLLAAVLNAITILFFLNLAFAVDSYGIVKNSLSVHIYAQTSSGGDGSGCGSGEEPIDGGTLPEVVITCGQYTGDCWKKDFGICFTGEYTYDHCEKSGKMSDNCNNVLKKTFRSRLIFQNYFPKLEYAKEHYSLALSFLNSY